MAFQVKMYTFAKKENSTARPITAGDTYECVIKEPCGILNPEISLNLGLTFSPVAYNYAYIQAFNKYYFVREWTFENRLWRASLDVDFLATWKTEIGASTCYILRSKAAHNGAIVDNIYPCKSDTTFTKVTEDNPWTTTLSEGMFVVGIAGQSTTYYLMTKGVLDIFFTNLFSNDYADALVGTPWVDVFPQLKAQSNPLQYVTMIMWLPFTAAGTLVTSVRVGWVDVPVVAAYQVTDAIRYDTLMFNIPNHPQHAARGEYLDNAPYSNYSLFIPPWGEIRLDADVVANSSIIVAWWHVDLRTGHGTLRIENNAGFVMSILHAQLGVNYQVSQVVNRGFGIGNLIAPALSVATSIATGNPIGAITGVASGIGDAVTSKLPTATTIGSPGGVDSLIGEPALQCEFKTIVDEDIEHLGRPLCESRQISTLPGYIKTLGAKVEIAATEKEKQSIITAMEGGFYYE